jgi:mannose-6-phosphate isomerase-like protein (cupin superfamily)
MTGQPPAFAGRPGEGEHLVFGGTTLIVRASAEMTGAAFSVFEESAPLLDTSRHVHASEDEMYYIVEGEHIYQCGDKEF